MDLYRIDDTDRMATSIIEGYDSLIWTERYRPAGDFQLKTAKIDATRTALPLNALVTLRDTLEVMIVETHSINVDPDGVRTLTVTGRTLESFLENRVAVLNNSALGDGGGSGDSILFLTAVTTASAAESFPDFGTGVDWRDGLYRYQFLDFTTKTLSISQRQVARTDCYSEMLKMLGEDNLGIRNERPPDLNIADSSYIIGVIYNGSNRSATVIFDVRAGHFENANYLWSTKGYKNAVYVAGPTGFAQVVAAGTTALSSFDRRTGVLNAPDVTQTSTAGLNILKAKGRAYLAENKKTAMIDGTVSPNIPYKYKTHYFLGDTIKVIGEYGLNQTMMVTEYIRIEDSTGERGYPTIVDPAEV